MDKIVIVGATSGIGYEVARGFIELGWNVGVAGRRKEVLDELVALAPERVKAGVIDILTDDAPEMLESLIEKLGGMDVYFHTSGIGYNNPQLDVEKELATVKTNTLGFTRMVLAAFHHFEKAGRGYIAVISSIAGTKGLGTAPAYSATKRYQRHYIDSLSQLAHMRRLKIRFTDIRPGFVNTALLKGDKYPLQMDVKKVATHIVHSLLVQKRVVVIDWKYDILVFFWRLVPEFVWERLRSITIK